MVIEPNYIIAVGGAGSSGLPALESGSQIIKVVSPSSTIIPPRTYDGS
jgi:hypothetical protein